MGRLSSWEDWRRRCSSRCSTRWTFTCSANRRVSAGPRSTPSDSSCSGRLPRRRARSPVSSSARPTRSTAARCPWPAGLPAARRETIPMRPASLLAAAFAASSLAVHAQETTCSAGRSCTRRSAQPAIRNACMSGRTAGSARSPTCAPRWRAGRARPSSDSARRTSRMSSGISICRTTD